MASTDAIRPLARRVQLRRQNSRRWCGSGGVRARKWRREKAGGVGAANDYVRVSRLFSGLSFFSPSRPLAPSPSPLALSPLLLSFPCLSVSWSPDLFRQISTTMSLWRETCLNLRHVPRTIPGDRMRHAQSMRFLSSSTRTPPALNARRLALDSRGSSLAAKARRSFQGLDTGRRSFSATAGVQHGHITPPKPGEE